MQRIDKVHERNLVAWARDKPDVLVLSGDLTASTEIHSFRETYPERFFSMGMAEQNMLSWAGGLAREGFTPFLHTFAVFLYRRPLDQLEMSVCYPDLPVRLVGFLPGLSTPGGVTHQAIDDIAVLRGLPNLTILEMGDATDVESVLDRTLEIDGPVYIRMLRGPLPRLFPAEEPLRLNAARVIGAGSDVTLLTTGICTEEAMRATAVLGRHGVSVTHLHVTTLKPFRDPAVLEAVSRAAFGVVTLENHVVTGGLGTCVAELMADNGVGRRLVRMGIRDRYAQGASLPYLMKEHGIDAPALVRQVEALLGEDFGVTEEAFEAVRLEEAVGAGAERLEAL